MWYDKYKDEHILINTSDVHNKFWSAYLDEKTYTVTVKWGRIGIKPQSQIKSFTSLYKAANFIDSKYREKANKGYKPIKQSELDRMCIEAAIIGTQNKCNKFAWVDIKGPCQYVFVTDAELYNPDIVPGIVVDLTTRGEIDGKHDFKFLFDFDNVFDLSTNTIIPKSSKLTPFIKKMTDVLCRSILS
jgi:predicted DNA-binding WGR domain protein